MVKYLTLRVCLNHLFSLKCLIDERTDLTKLSLNEYLYSQSRQQLETKHMLVISVV